MGQNRQGKERERIVCFCYNVSESVIVAAIKGGCQTLMDVRRQTYASTGCAGCGEEVKKLLRKYTVRSEEPGNAGNG